MASARVAPESGAEIDYDPSSMESFDTMQEATSAKYLHVLQLASEGEVIAAIVNACGNPDKLNEETT